MEDNNQFRVKDINILRESIQTCVHIHFTASVNNFCTIIVTTIEFIPLYLCMFCMECKLRKERVNDWNFPEDWLFNNMYIHM